MVPLGEGFKDYYVVRLGLGFRDCYAVPRAR